VWLGCLHELFYSRRAGNSMTVLLPGLRKATSDERENDSAQLLSWKDAM
jgi:hypothetical protein